MVEHSFLAKVNQDGSYSISITAGKLVEIAFVDYYEERSGTGYQRLETLTPKRAREIAGYMKRCAQLDIPHRLFELTANARTDKVKFEKVDKNGILGNLYLNIDNTKPFLSIIDGGTRFLGIRNALSDNIIEPDARFDFRLFTGLTIPQEIAMFLLINDKQKKVRTDLGLRVVQKQLDEGELHDDEKDLLQAVVDTDAWRFEASKVTASLNNEVDSAWKDLIQMPNDKTSKPVKMQAMFTSLKPLLTNDDINTKLRQIYTEGALKITGDKSVKPTEFLVKIIKNFWKAVAEVNPNAHAEPKTTVLWGSIGASACHIALSRIIATKLINDANPDFSLEAFKAMIQESQIADYDFWFTKSGSKDVDYPDKKGDAPTFTGVAGYSRLASSLEQEWRSNMHSAKKQTIAIA